MAKAGYCSECKQNVWLKDDGSCQSGHSANQISNIYEVETKKLAGYCSECKQNVWLKEDKSCQNGHPASVIEGIYEVSPRAQTARRATQKATSINEFASLVLSGPAECRIKVSQLEKLYDAIVPKLYDKGMETHEIVKLIDEKIVGVCPKCSIVTAGKGLSMMATAKLFSNVMFTGSSGGAERLMAGLCRNNSCSCKDILIFWQLTAQDPAGRLARMGVNIKDLRDW